MKTILFKSSISIFIIVEFFLISCKKQDQEPCTLITKKGNIQVSLPDSIKIKVNTRWGWTVHDNMTYYCAKQWGLSDDRAQTMLNASHMPDIYDVEGQIPGTQNWLHGWVQIINGVWVWGSADNACNNNIQGIGWNGKCSFYYYKIGNISQGDWYLGYAAHYMEDCGNPWHTSANIVQQLSTHSDYETWVDNNWTNGFNFSLSISSDYYYYSVTNPKDAVKALAIYSNSQNSIIYKAFLDSGSPTKADIGNTVLVSETRQLLINTSRYVKGLMKFTLDAKNAW